MIKKIYNVIYNEIYKQLKKKSFCIIVAVILLLAIALPFALKYVSFSPEESLEYLKTNINTIDTQQEEVKKSEKAIDKIKTKLYTIEKEVLTLKYENKIGQEDFRGSELDKYEVLSKRIILLDALISNISEKDLEELKFDFLRNESELDNYVLLSNNARVKERDKLIKEKDEAKRIVIEKDYDAYLKNDLANLEKILKEETKALEKTRKAYEKDKGNEELGLKVYQLEKNINYLQGLKVVKEFKVDSKLSFEKTDWRARTVSNLEQNIDAFNEEVKAEKEFLANPYYDGRKIGYTEYTEKFYENRLKVNEEIKKDWYSLQNNIPQIQYIKDARSIVYGTMDVFILLTIIVIIIAGAGIVSNEFSKGTVRLLLIRPISRFKIVVGKLLSLITIGIVLVTLSTTLLIISSGIAFGFDSLSIPIVSYYNGSAISVNFFKFMTEGVLISSVGVLFIISVVFSLSTLSRNTAVAVATGIILYIGAMPITLVLAGSMGGAIVSTFIPYMNMQIFRIIPSFEALVSEASGMELNYPFGVIQLLVISLVLIVITMIVFLKRDVRN